MNKKLVFSAMLLCLLLAVVVGVAFAQTSPSVVRWEYRVFDVTAQGMPTPAQVQQTLNSLGQEGWELADTMVSGWIFMKRRLP